jgi:hypothetical protein
MIRRYIHACKSCFLTPEQEASSTEGLIPEVPKRAARRMSLLGKQMHYLLNEVQLDLETSIVYGTSYTEARALESFLDSLPFASPTAFQTSIHPGGIEQALIMAKREAGSLFPLAGGASIFLSMAQTALTSTSPKTIILGGEESGTWLDQFGLAHPRSFAFSLEIAVSDENAIGLLDWDPRVQSTELHVPGLEAIAQSIQTRDSITLRSPDHGRFEIKWL